MKISKLFAIPLQLKSRLVFFAVAVVYNLLLGVYLKGFLVLSPRLLTFYLLSALPALFLLIDVQSKSMRAVIFVILGLILLMNIAYTLNCRRIIAFPTVICLVFELLYFGAQKTLPTKQGLCFDFAHLFAAFCRSQNIPCYAVDGISRKKIEQIGTLGTACTMMELGGM